jgi:hypothetical protein
MSSLSAVSNLPSRASLDVAARRGSSSGLRGLSSSSTTTPAIPPVAVGTIGASAAAAETGGDSREDAAAGVAVV